MGGEALDGYPKDQVEDFVLIRVGTEVTSISTRNAVDLRTTILCVLSFLPDILAFVALESMDHRGSYSETS
jgi:hypothetical protein